MRLRRRRPAANQCRRAAAAGDRSRCGAATRHKWPRRRRRPPHSTAPGPVNGPGGRSVRCRPPAHRAASPAPNAARRPAQHRGATTARRCAPMHRQGSSRHGPTSRRPGRRTGNAAAAGRSGQVPARAQGWGIRGSRCGVIGESPIIPAAGGQRTARTCPPPTLEGPRQRCRTAWRKQGFKSIAQSARRWAKAAGRHGPARNIRS